MTQAACACAKHKPRVRGSATRGQRELAACACGASARLAWRLRGGVRGAAVEPRPRAPCTNRWSARAARRWARGLRRDANLAWLPKALRRSCYFSSEVCPPIIPPQDSSEWKLASRRMIHGCSGPPSRKRPASAALAGWIPKGCCGAPSVCSRRPADGADGRDAAATGGMRRGRVAAGSDSVVINMVRAREVGGWTRQPLERPL